MIEQSGSNATQPLGELLLGRELLSEEQLAHALAEQQQSARPLGEILIGLGYISAPTMAQALATQRGGVTKTEYGYAVGFKAPSDVTVAELVPPPPVTAIAGPTPGPDEPVAGAAVAPLRIAYAEPAGVAPAAAEPPVAVDLNAQASSPVVTEPVDAALRAELAAAVAARDALAAQLAEARGESAAARDKLVEVERRLEEVRVQAASREEETAASAKDEADGLRAQLAELRGMADAVAATEARAAELERAAGDAEARIAQAAGQLQALTAERDELRGRVDALLQEREAMDGRAAELERTAESLRAELARRPSKPEPALQADEVGLEARLAALESRLEHAVDMLGVLRGERESVDALERLLATVAAEQRIAEETSVALAAQLEERTRQYETAMAELQRAHAAAAAPEPEPAAPGEQAYLIFGTLAGRYEIVESVGVVPTIGDEIEVDGTTHAVVRVGGSPLAGSDLACVYTIPTA